MGTSLSPPQRAFIYFSFVYYYDYDYYYLAVDRSQTTNGQNAENKQLCSALVGQNKRPASHTTDWCSNMVTNSS